MLSHQSTQNTGPSNDTFICSLPDCAFVVDRFADCPAFERPENYGYCACSGGQALDARKITVIALAQAGKRSGSWSERRRIAK
jgi:hypothetical protein